MTLIERFILLEMFAAFTATVVVNDQHRVLVEQCGLKTAVRTNVGASLFAKMSKDCVENRGKQKHERQPLQMVQGIVRDDRPQLLDAGDVTEQRIADHERHENEHNVLELSSRSFSASDSRRSALRVIIAFNPILDPTKNHFHQQRLRARPPAPESPESSGENNNAGDKEEQCHSKNRRILRPENVADDDELTLNNVNEQERIALNFYERPNKCQGEQREAHHRTQFIQRALRLFCAYPFAFAFLIGCREVVAKILRVQRI